MSYEVDNCMSFVMPADMGAVWLEIHSCCLLIISNMSDAFMPFFFQPHLFSNLIWIHLFVSGAILFDLIPLNLWYCDRKYCWTCDDCPKHLTNMSCATVSRSHTHRWCIHSIDGQKAPTWGREIDLIKFLDVEIYMFHKYILI